MSIKPRRLRTGSKPLSLSGPWESLINALSPLARAAMDGASRLHFWENGASVSRAGEAADSLLVLEEGRLRVSTVTEGGTEYLFGRIEVGEQLGISSVLTGEVMPFTAIAAGKCTTRHISKTDLHQLMTTHPEIAIAIARFLAIYLYRYMDRASQISQDRRRTRVYETLQRLAMKESEGDDRPEVELKISQYDLACMLGCSRQHLNTQLHALQRQGLIRLGYRTIVLISAHNRRTLSEHDVTAYAG